MPSDKKEDQATGGLAASVIGVLGAGPIGCLLGVCLACAGVDVTVVDWPGGAAGLVELVHEFGARVVNLVPGATGDSERTVGPRDATRRFSKDVGILARCNMIFVAVPRARLPEVTNLLKSHAATGADVLLMQPGSGAAQELIACGLSKGKWRGRHLMDACAQLRAELKIEAGQPVTITWHTPLESSRISLDGRPSCLESSKRISRILRSAGLPAVVEESVAEVQLHDSVFHRLADLLSLASERDTLATAFALKAWRRALALLVEEALVVLRGAGLPTRRVAGMSPGAQRNYPRVLRAPSCVFRFLQGYLPGEILECPCNLDVSGSLAEAAFPAEEITQLGRRHGVATPRLTFLLEHLKESAQAESEVSGGHLLQQLGAASLPLVQPRADPRQEAASNPPAAVVGQTTLADTLLVKKHSRRSDDGTQAAPEAAPSAMALFGADPAENDGLRAGASTEEPALAAEDLEMAFSDYKQKKANAQAKGSMSGGKKSKADVEAALKRFEQSKDKGRASR